MDTDIEFPEMAQAIIAMKGLPCTGKSEIARLLSKWARFPVVYIDDYLDALSLEKGYTSAAKPSDKEAEHIHYLAMDALYKAALRRQSFHSLFDNVSSVVVKSRLRYTFEIDKLMQLATEISLRTMIVLECQMKNEHRFRLRLDSVVRRFGHEAAWYKAVSWNDIDEAREDSELNAQTWEDYLTNKIHFMFEEENSHVRIIRLVLDPFDDLDIDPPDTGLIELTPSFLKVMNYLLTGWASDFKEEDSFARLLNKHQYVVVHFDKVRRYLAEKELSDSSSQDRAGDLCFTNNRRNCVFKLISSKDLCCCGMCEEQVVREQPIYTCYFCNLALHKSCAELMFDDQHFSSDGDKFPFTQVVACESCTKGGKGYTDECRSCLIRMLLKHPEVPIIVNSEYHGEHFLSLLLVLEESSLVFNCKACGKRGCYFAYGCYICQVYYHTQCAGLPREVEHQHGGHKHVMKLVYSRDGVEEESYWCDSCYEDMDPQLWFYSCQGCPYYAAHPGCVLPMYDPF